MPWNKARYPENWAEISHQIRFVRAGGKCERCGLAHGQIGRRDRSGVWHDQAEIDAMPWDEMTRLFRPFKKYTTVWLTTAHLGVPYPDGRPGDKHNKMDCRPENLAALCQGCHLAEDRADHVAAAAKTRQRKRQAALAAIGKVTLPGFEVYAN